MQQGSMPRSAPAQPDGKIIQPAFPWACRQHRAFARPHPAGAAIYPHAPAGGKPASHNSPPSRENPCGAAPHGAGWSSSACTACSPVLAHPRELRLAQQVIGRYRASLRAILTGQHQHCIPGGDVRWPPAPLPRRPPGIDKENLVTSGNASSAPGTRPILASVAESPEMSDTRTQYFLTSPNYPSADFIAAPPTPRHYHQTHPTAGARLQAPHDMPRRHSQETEPCKD